MAVEITQDNQLVRVQCDYMGMREGEYAVHAQARSDGTIFVWTDSPKGAHGITIPMRLVVEHLHKLVAAEFKRLKR